MNKSPLTSPDHQGLLTPAGVTDIALSFLATLGYKFAYFQKRETKKTF